MRGGPNVPAPRVSLGPPPATTPNRALVQIPGSPIPPTGTGLVDSHETMGASSVGASAGRLLPVSAGTLPLTAELPGGPPIVGLVPASGRRELSERHRRPLGARTEP